MLPWCIDMQFWVGFCCVGARETRPLLDSAVFVDLLNDALRGRCCAGSFRSCPGLDYAALMHCKGLLSPGLDYVASLQCSGLVPIALPHCDVALASIMMERAVSLGVSLLRWLVP